MSLERAPPPWPGIVNGMCSDALFSVMVSIRQDPAKGKIDYTVKTDWLGQTRSWIAGGRGLGPSNGPIFSQ